MNVKLLENSKFVNGNFIYQGDKQYEREVYNFVRIAILDGKVPINKIIGFKIVDDSCSDIASAISRHTEMLESMIELSKNLQDIVLVDQTSAMVETSRGFGSVMASSIKFRCNSKDIQLLDSNIYLFTSKKQLALRFIVAKNTGSKLIDENVQIMKSLAIGDSEAYNTFFPMNTYHNLYGSMFILPYINGGIRYRLSKNITDEKINTIWISYVKELLINEC